MKKETFEEAKATLETLSKVQSSISKVVEGRGSYYDNEEKKWCYDGLLELKEIVIRTYNSRNNHNIESIEIEFESGQFKNNLKLSPNAQQLIQAISVLFRDTVSNILLKEEENLKKHFAELKDETN